MGDTEDADMLEAKENEGVRAQGSQMLCCLMVREAFVLPREVNN
jgi:hypothetical protein